MSEGNRNLTPTQFFDILESFLGYQDSRKANPVDEGYKFYLTRTVYDACSLTPTESLRLWARKPVVENERPDWGANKNQGILGIIEAQHRSYNSPGDDLKRRGIKFQAVETSVSEDRSRYNFTYGIIGFNR